MKATKISDNIYWVGAIDWNLRSFHGYDTSNGSSYNAYLIIDEKITLIDNVKEGFKQELLERIASVVDPSKIDIIISNHGEPDHSGAINDITNVAKNATIYVSGAVGEKILKAYYGDTHDIKVVKTGDKLNTGKYNFTFLQTPFVHWPDNMVTYLEEEKILFSNDCFGQHYASSSRFDYNADPQIAIIEARKYYANIVLPYSKQALKACKLLEDLQIDIIAPSHGIIWKEYVKEIRAQYDEMANRVTREKAVIVYDTMYDSTRKIAYAIADAFDAKNIPYQIIDVNVTPFSDIITEIMDSKYLAIGSPTANNVMLPNIAGFLHYLKGLNPTGLKYIAFGSYGWSGQSIDMIKQSLDEMKYEPVLDPIKVLYVPSKEQILDITNSIIEKL